MGNGQTNNFGRTVVGVPAEVYRNGITYAVLLLSEVTGALTAMIFFIPFFYKLRLTSVYEVMTEYVSVAWSGMMNTWVLMDFHGF